MAAKEAVVVAAAVFGRQWAGKLVNFTVDNLATVQVISATYSKESYLMHLVHLLVFFAAHFNFGFWQFTLLGEPILWQTLYLKIMLLCFCHRHLWYNPAQHQFLLN